MEQQNHQPPQQEVSLKRPRNEDDNFIADEETSEADERKFDSLVAGRPATVSKRIKKGGFELEQYNYKVAIESWDQIGSLASEVTTSVLAQLAEGMSEQMRAETEMEASRAKRRRQSYRSSLSNNKCSPAEPVLVSSDDEQISNFAPPLSWCLSQKIDRMARMSKYMMQIERYHRLLRTEMISIMEENEEENEREV